MNKRRWKKKRVDLTLIAFTIGFTLLTALILHSTLLRHKHDHGGHYHLQRSLEELVNQDPEFVAPNDLLRHTAIGIKTYNRPQCLKDIIASIRQYAPYLPIYVIDDSDADVRAMTQDGDLGDIYISLPTDSGVGYGRNIIVESIYKAGYKYVIMADDDFKLIASDTIPNMAKYMRDTEADVVAATRCDNTLGNCHRSKGLLLIDQTNMTLVVLPNVTSYPKYQRAPNCFRSDLVQQFFMAKTEKLLNIRWDDNLKNNDHYDFLLNAKLNNLKLVTCTDIQILHDKKCESVAEHAKQYKTQREQRWFSFLSYILYKWGLTMIYDEVGKKLMVNDTGYGLAEAQAVVKISIFSNDTRYYLQKVVEALNSDRAAWTWLHPIYNKDTWVVRQPINPCTELVSGSLSAKYERYITFKNEHTNHHFNMYLYNESCSLAESLWRLRSYGKLSTKSHIYYVTAISDDTSYMKRLLHVLDMDKDRQDMTLIIVLMDLDSAKLVQANSKTVGYEVIIINQGPPFSRSIGLKIGFQHAITLANSRGQVSAIGFSIDTSILVPNDFSRRIRQNAICGVSAFVPVVYKCMSCLDNMQDRSDGYWVYTGFGMVGLCLTDYMRTGGWSTVWGYRWGGEDVDLMERLGQHMHHIIRTEEPDYIYVRNPSAKEKNPSYYMNKNLFPKPLPPSSLTTDVTDSSLKQRLLLFIQSHSKQLSKEVLDIVKVSRTYTTGAHGINYHILLRRTSDEDYLLWFSVHSYLSPLL